MQVKDTVKMAFAALRLNAARSLLTILGIVIGVASVIVMLSVGRSAEQLILSQVADLGSDLIFVEASAGGSDAGPPSPFIEQTLDLEDWRDLKNLESISAINAAIFTTLPVTVDGEGSFTQVSGVTEDYIEVFPADLLYGRFIDANDVESNARVAVLGKDIAQDLFGDQNPVGERVRMKGNSFRVIGVFDEQGTRFFQNLDEQIAVPITTAQTVLLGVDYINFLAAKMNASPEQVRFDITDILRDNHDLDIGEPDDFLISTQGDAQETVGVIGNVLTILLASIAAISLIVGGIGIMNIMLVSVAERTKEIGLRQSIGATRNEILQQFLLEAFILTTIGGCIGIAIGVGISLIAGPIVGNYVDGWQGIVRVESIILGFVVSSAIGIVFGIYPARRASRLEPVDALRYE